MDGLEFALSYTPLTYVLCVYNDKQEMIVGIKPDGSVEYGPGYTTTEQSARDFWEILGRTYPTYVNETFVKAGA